jgi:malonyl-CoA/methylmalonyl-CoA synthetase
VTIVGRSKDLIISGGFNVYPKEVEEVIDDLAGVTESAVIGVPHPDFGEGVIAVVVADPGVEVSEDGIVTSLSDKLARFKQPKHVFVVHALPRNAMGKVQKKELRERYADVFKG